MTLKVATILQTLGVALQATVPQVTSDHTQQTVYAVSIGIAQLAAGIAAMFYNPNGSSASEPYVKRKRKSTSIMGLLPLVLLSLIGISASAEMLKFDGYQPVWYKKNMQWNTSGVGGSDNDFWLTPVNKSAGLCIALVNKDAVAKPITVLSAYYNFNPAADPNEINITGMWPQPAREGNLTTTIPADGLTWNFFRTQGAGKVVIKLNGGAAVGRVDMYAIESASCGSDTEPYLAGVVSVMSSAFNGVANSTLSVFPIGGQDTSSTNMVRMARVTQNTQHLMVFNRVCNSVVASGFNVIETTLAAIPFAAMTQVAGQTSCIHTLTFNNSTAGPLTVTVQDRSGTPIPLLSAYSIPANSMVSFDVNAVPMNAGFSWQASAIGITGSVQYSQ